MTDASASGTDAVHWPVIRAAELGDLAAVAELNEANVPEVGPTTREALAEFLVCSELFLVAVDHDGTLVAFMIVLHEGTDYASPNYRWFEARFNRFLYVDRIAVHDRCRGAGIGRRLYDVVTGRAREGRWPVVCAEVNVQPRNDASLAFHARRGFTVLAEVADPRYDELIVAMMRLDVPPA